MANSQAVAGQNAEALAFGLCQARGFSVDWSTHKNARFDLLINGHRVQVKCRTAPHSADKPYRIYLQKSAQTPYSTSEIDAVALLFLGEWYVIPCSAIDRGDGRIVNSFDIRRFTRFKDGWSFFADAVCIADPQLDFGFWR